MAATFWLDHGQFPGCDQADFYITKYGSADETEKLLTEPNSDTNVECCGLLQINQIEGHHHLVGSLATVMFDVWRSNRTKITDVFGRGCEVTDEVKIFLERILVLNNE